MLSKHFLTSKHPHYKMQKANNQTAQRSGKEAKQVAALPLRLETGAFVTSSNR
jgi:hypothetical protein